MPTRFAGQLALVTGGTGGLGRAVSLAFLKEGASVMATYREQKELDELQRAAATGAASLQGHRVDVTDVAAVDQFVERLIAENGRLDVLVNTVGAYAGGTKLWESDPRVFERMLALNLRSGYLISRAVVPAMLQRGRGAIVNIASKAAAVAMMDSLAAGLQGTGVRVNSVLPSIIDTEANRKAMPNADFSKWPKPEEIASVILFLCSDEAKLIHGAAVPV